MKSFLFFFLSIFFIWDVASGGGLSPSPTVDGTAVLPKGVRSPRLRHYNINIDSKKNAHGKSQPLAQGMNKQITWNQVLAKQEGVKKDLLKAQLEAMGMDLAKSGPGSIAADVNIGLNVSVPIFGYGLSDTDSIGLIVPVYQVETSIAHSFVANAEGKAWSQALSPSAKADAKAALEAALASKLHTMGYSSMESESFTALGDIQFAYKKQFYKKDQHSFQWKNYLIAPTGKEPNADKLVDVPTGDGQWDISTGLVYQYDAYIPYSSVKSRYVFNTSYTHQFADSIEKRIPEEEGSPLSSEKEKVDRKLGDQIQAGFGMVLGNTRAGSSLGMSYEYQYSFPTKYNGSRYESQRYSWLEDLEGEQELESLTLAYSYSTIEAFRKKQFAVPMTATISLARPLSGKNINDAEIYFGELIVYF